MTENFDLCGVLKIDDWWFPIYMIPDTHELVCDTDSLGTCYISNLLVTENGVDCEEETTDSFQELADSMELDGIISTVDHLIHIKNYEATVYDNLTGESVNTVTIDLDTEFNPNDI